MQQSGKIKNIEFLRIVFAIIVTFVHLKDFILKTFDIPLYNNIVTNTCYAGIAVDFFFIISGFFLFIKTDFSQKFINFAVKKFLRLMPLVFYSCLVYLILSFFTPIKFLKYDNALALLTLSNCGLTYNHCNNVCIWYISALFWGINFYFYLYKITDRKVFNFITACIIFFCYAFWLHSKGNHFINVYSFVNRGMLKAFANIGVGYFIVMLYKDYIDRIKAVSLNIWQKLLFTGLEVYLLCFLVFHMSIHKFSHYKNPLILIVAFIGLFILFLIKKGYLSRLLENDFSVFLGRYSFAIFMTHVIICDIWRNILCKSCHDWIIAHPELNLVIFYITVISFGVFTYHFVEKPVAKFLKSKYIQNL